MTPTAAVTDPNLMPPGGIPGGGEERLAPEILQRLRQRYGNVQDPNMPPGAIPMSRIAPVATPPAESAPVGTPGVGAAGPTEIATATLLFRAVSLTHAAPSANTDIAYALLDELKASPLFEPNGTQFFTEIIPDEASGTFTFGVTLALKQPLKF
jgi:hypothetical protein